MVMKIKKQIFRSGNSFVIYLDKIIMDNLELKSGDFVDISDIVKVRYKPLPKNQTINDIKNNVRRSK